MRDSLQDARRDDAMSTLFPSAKKPNSLLRQWQGPLTESLLREPSALGLGQLPKALKPDAVVSSVCGYCSTGCALNIHLKDGLPVNLSANNTYPVNLGMACPKGWEALTPLNAPDRGITPLVKTKEGTRAPIEWSQAAALFSQKFQSIQERYGKSALAWIGTGQMPTEELALLGAVAKFGMGIIHGDGNTRQCMATAATAYKQSFGFDAPPFTYADFEESDVIILIGSNLCIAHPIMWQRVMRNRRNPTIIVIDPRTTETAMAATEHFAINPKSDLAFFYGIARQLIEDDTIDRNFISKSTSEFQAFVAFLRDYSLSHAASASGISIDRLHWLVNQIGSGKRVSFWWTMGVNQSYEGTRLAQSIINLALMTGNIGKPGTGANSITGQCNAMGSRILSNTTNLFGGRAFENPEHRTEVANILGIPVENIPTTPSLAYDEIIDGIENGTIKGLWIIATNPAHSWVNQNRLHSLMEKLEFLVVQDMYHSTETAQLADLYLPAAAWGEKEGTFINSERRIGRFRAVATAPGQAKSDFTIFHYLAEAWGCSPLFKEWKTPEAVFKILQELTRGRPCDFSGIKNYAHLDASGGIQWPYTKEPVAVDTDSATERRLFTDGVFFHPDGKARFYFSPPNNPPEITCTSYPFVLLTGRGTSAQWHTQTRTSKSAVLRKLYPQEAYVEINDEDADRLGVEPNEYVEVSSRRGSIIARAYCCQTVQPGHLFLPMHYPAVNQLTISSFDPHSRQPSYKQAAVALRRLPNNRQ